MSGKQRCSFEGCRAWARRRPGPEGSQAEAAGGAWCSVHGGTMQRRRGGAPKGNQNARKHGVFGTYVPVVVLEEALKLPPGDLRLEIAVVRGILAELVKADLALPELAKAVDAATSSLARLLRTNKHLGEDRPDEFQETVAQVLRDLGLGGV